MARTPIDPSTLGATHVDNDQLVEITWPVSPDEKTRKTSVRGVLTRVQHDQRGALITVMVGGQELTINPHTDPAEVALID